MASRPSDDPLDCFTFLAENVPSWLSRVSELAHHTAARHIEFSAEYVKLAGIGNSRVLPQRRRKTSSLNSNRIDERPKKADGPTPAPAPAATETKPPSDDPSSSHLGTGDPFRDPLTLIRLSGTQPQDLKRKHPDTSPSISSPDPKHPTRIRHAVIVHYDSHTQRALEMLVRDFGGARNRMRKGRMNHMMKTGFALKPGFATNGVGIGFDDVRPMFRSSRIDASKNAQSTKEDSPFDIVDKNLESAQALCEVGAHQFLRSGDCGAELEKTINRLEIVLATAKSEADRLRAELEKKAKAQQILKEDQKRNKPDPKILKSDKIPVDGIDGTIEVDDDSDSSSVSIDIKAFRRSRNR
jgi:hypothetical protein